MKGRGGKWKAAREGSPQIKQRCYRIAAAGEVQPSLSIGSWQHTALWHGAWLCPRSCLLLARKKGHLGRGSKVFLAKSGCRFVCVTALKGLCQGPDGSAVM